VSRTLQAVGRVESLQSCLLGIESAGRALLKARMRERLKVKEELLDQFHCLRLL